MAGFGRFFFSAGSAVNYRSILSTRSCLPNFQSCGVKMKAPSRAVLEKLGIPPRPKKPALPYNQFVSQEYKTLQSQNVKANEMFKVISDKWRNVDLKEKEKMQEIYESEVKVWVEKIMDYENSLTEEQRQLIQKTQEKKKARKEKLALSKQCRETGKPKRPASTFSQYLKVKGPKPADANVIEWFKERVAEWKILPEEEKAKYRAKYNEELEKYHKEVEAWEEKMVSQGRTDLLTNNVLKKIKASSESSNQPKNAD